LCRGLGSTAWTRTTAEDDAKERGYGNCNYN
jgi:hypothetical protein